MRGISTGEGAKSQCPGEEKCARFYRVAGKNQVEREFKACHGGNFEKPICSAFPTKHREVEFDKSLMAVEDFIVERDAGLNPDPDELTLLEYEGVKLWQRYEQMYERQFKQSVVNLASVIPALLRFR